MVKKGFKDKLKLYENFNLSEKEIRNIKSNMISKINTCVDNDYKMTKDLYNEIISLDM